MKKKILLLAGDFVEDYEVMVPYQALTMLGYIVHVVCPYKKEDELIKTAIHDFEGDQTYTEKPGHLFKINYNFFNVRVDDYTALVIPGGRAPEYLRLNKSVLEMIVEFNQKGKPIAAICHGIQILTAANILKNRHCSAYPACKVEVEQSGGVYVDLPFEEAHVDGNLVTAPAWTAHPIWLSKFIKLLGAQINI